MCVCVCKACNVHACSGKQHMCVCARCCTLISCTCVAALHVGCVRMGRTCKCSPVHVCLAVDRHACAYL